MNNIIQVKELDESTIVELSEQLKSKGFTDSDIEEFKEQPIDAVEETLQSTTFYLFRNDDNKPVTIVNNRTTKETEYVVIEFNDGRIEFYDDVVSLNTYINKEGIKELAIRVWWGGEQTATGFMELSKVKDFYYINNPNHIIK